MIYKSETQIFFIFLEYFQNTANAKRFWVHIFYLPFWRFFQSKKVFLLKMSHFSRDFHLIIDIDISKTTNSFIFLEYFQNFITAKRFWVHIQSHFVNFYFWKCYFSMKNQFFSLKRDFGIRHYCFSKKVEKLVVQFSLRPQWRVSSLKISSQWVKWVKSYGLAKLAFYCILLPGIG